MLSVTQRRFESLALRTTKLTKSFTKGERLTFFALVAALLVSVGMLSVGGGSNVAAADGGVYIEGVVGRPNSINPLFASTNNVDLDLTRLIYTGLTRIGPGREVLPALAERWDITDGGRTYIFHLRPNVTWHDGEKLTADDVVFTVNVLQNNDYTGVLKSSFAKIAVEKLDETTVKFTLPAASAFFLTDVAVGVIPRHLFKDIPVKEMLASSRNPKMIIGTGMYQFDHASGDEEITLRKNKDFYDTKPHIDALVFYFFDNTRSLLTALKNHTVGAAGVPAGDLDDGLFGGTSYSYTLPQYKGIYFNQLGNNNAVKSKAVRQALAYALNKAEIVKEVEGTESVLVDSPILPGFWGHKPDIKKYDYSLTAAAEALRRDGWKDIDQDGFVEKDNTRLSFKVSLRDDEAGIKLGEILKTQWKLIGAEVTVETKGIATLIKDVIRPRNYDVLVFGQDLGTNPDPYVYWHSSQIKDPGLALAVQVDKDIDNNLEAARIAPDLGRTIEAYHKFQNAFADLVPAILLYQPKYTYIVDSKVKGITDKINLSTLSDRFANIEQWYIKTKRS